MLKVHFLSNHKDTSFLEEYLKADIERIPHPYIEPDWSEEEVWSNCIETIRCAVDAETLVANGDYFLVGVVLRERLKAGKPTGFIAMKKFNEPSNEKDADGNIVHRNILRPIAVRWIS